MIAFLMSVTLCDLTETWLTVEEVENKGEVEI